MNNPARRVDPQQNLQVVVERVVSAQRERVFRAWTDPVLIEKWFAPAGMTPVGVEASPVVGGSYRIGMRQPGGKTNFVSGKYIEIVPPERLVFTWAWQSDPPEAASLVTVEFFEQGSATRLVLTHVKLPDHAAQEDHRRGWEACLDQLEANLAAGNL